MLILLALTVCGQVWAIPYDVGKYKVDVTVRNSAMNLIPNVKVYCSRYNSKNIAVEAYAAGYKSFGRLVAIQENQTLYKVDLVLQDLDREIFIVDHNDRPIESAYNRPDQFGFPGDHYGLTVYIPKLVWKHTGIDRVEVFDSFWGMPMKKSYEVTEIDEFYCVKLSVTRKSIKWSGSRLYVVFRTSAPVRPEVVSGHLRQLRELESDPEKYPAGSSEALTRYVIANFLEEAARSNGVPPRSLQKAISLKLRFMELHGE